MSTRTETLPKQETKNETKKDDLIFAFDLGSASIGECVREGNEILHIASLLIPNDFASIREQATRRRQWRTRLAHKARENWWRKKAQEAGIEILESQRPTVKNPDAKPDPRLLKEFRTKNEDTIYTSCLLRIALLQGRKLESWQIYKAIRNAIQHRGYDPDNRWERKDATDDEKIKKQQEDKKANIEAVSNYEKFLDEHFGKGSPYHYPCYFEAYRMGIWNPKDPQNLSNKTHHKSTPARNKNTESKKYVIPRKLIIAELELLLKKAAEQFPKLKNKEKEIIFGPGKQEYASLNCSEYRKHRGTNWDWQGLVSQKIPRFDNRAINKCCLIPRFNVCSSVDILNREVVFLLKLKNMRYVSGAKTNCMLDPNQLKETFEEFKNRLEKKTKSGLHITITKNDWKNWVEEKFKGNTNLAHIKVEAPTITGRSRFCRPALTIMKKLILSGKNPHDFYREEISKITNTDKQKGLIKEDYDFLMKMENNWYFISVPDDRTENINFSKQQRQERINYLTNKILNPVVSHRLKLFRDRLDYLSAKFGEPSRVILEFVRDKDNSLYGKKKKKQYTQFRDDNKKEKDIAFKQMTDAGHKGKENLTRMILYRQQKGLDIYDGKPIDETKLHIYDIDHIVPTSKKGPDTMFNKVLTSSDNNQEKGDRTPYKWLYDTDKWDAYFKRVNSIYKLTGGAKERDRLKKKKELLTAHNAEELAENYSALTATAWLEKAAAQIANLYYGWKQGTRGSKQRIFVVNGQITAKFRKKYKLNKLLHPTNSEQEIREWENKEKINEKNRDNPRHHALDALVISYAYNPHIVERKDGSKTSILPGLKPEIAEGALKRVYPNQIAYPRAKLAETVYGLRKITNEKGKEEIYAVTRSFTGETKNGASILHYYDFAKAKKLIRKIIDIKLKTELNTAFENCKDEQQWKQFLDDYRRETGIKKISVKVSDKPIDPADICEDKKLYGIYKDFNKNIDTSRKQLFTDKKEHKGQLVCQKQNGKWEVIPVYTYDSLYRKTYETKNAKDKNGNKKYKQVLFFRSRDLVKLQENITNKNIEKGVYRLITLKSNGTTKLKSIDELLEISASITDFLNQGKMCHFEGEVLK